jgi:hypothetical protein
MEDNMRQLHGPSKRAAVAGALLAIAHASAGVSALAQDATTSPTATSPTPVASATKKAPRTTATPDLIADAVARSKARHARFLTSGTPEQFGSEEPYAPATK